MISRHLPEPEGTSPGRVLRATVDGLRADGHDVTAWCWGPEPPRAALPDWCTWQPLPGEPWLRMKGRALLRPRHDVRTAGWEPPVGAVPVADDPVSFPAVAGRSGCVLTQHYLTRLDRRALGRRQLRDVQDLRAERWNTAHAEVVLVYSPRVAAALGRGATTPPTHVVPVAYPVPEAAVAPVEEPVAVLVADWRWPPNRWAQRQLLAAWPAVVDAVPGARLLLAGRGLEPWASGTVRSIGTFDRAADVLAEAAVLAFPCPATSGPKIKVLEALAHGLPVVTTEWGVEGLAPGGAAVTPAATFATALANVLADPARRSVLAAEGRAATAHHAPLAAARARVAAIATVR